MSRLLFVHDCFEVTNLSFECFLPFLIKLLFASLLNIPVLFTHDLLKMIMNLLFMTIPILEIPIVIKQPPLFYRFVYDIL